MISSIQWIPRGLLKRFPVSYLDEHPSTDTQSTEATADPKREGKEGKSVVSPVFQNGTNTERLLKRRANRAKTNLLDTSSSEEEEDDERSLVNKLFRMHPLDTSAVKDPHLDDTVIDSEDEEAKEILPDDYVLVTTLAEEDAATMEIYIFDEEKGNLFVHHDIIIPENPLCTEYIKQQKYSEVRNLLAIGFMDPVIQFWDLDYLDRLDPVLSLPSSVEGKSLKKRKISATLSTDGHTEAVMSLQRCPQKSHILASGSADTYFKIWDIDALCCLSTYALHKDKVQSVRWHPIEDTVLLTAAFDQTVYLTDTRKAKGIRIGSLSSDAECTLWDRHHSTLCLCGCEDGELVAFDIRKLSDNAKLKGKQKKGNNCFLWSFKAHDSALTSLADTEVNGMLMSCSLDTTAKIWNLNKSTVQEGSIPAIEMVYEKPLKAGPLLCCQSNPDLPTSFSFGGDCVVVWDTAEASAVTAAFNLG